MRVLSTECTGCMSCVAACTVPDCLGVTRKGARAWSAWLVPALALGVMLGFWAVARATGFWETSVTADAFRWAYRAMGIGQGYLLVGPRAARGPDRGEGARPEKPEKAATFEVARRWGASWDTSTRCMFGIVGPP